MNLNAAESLTIAIPALNEEGAIEGTITRCLDACVEIGIEMGFSRTLDEDAYRIDDQSSDPDTTCVASVQ